MYKRIMLPWEFAELPLRKKALVMAFVDQYVAEEKREAARAKSVKVV